MNKKLYRRDYQRARRAALRANNLCVWCGHRPAKPGECRCEECAAVAAAKTRAALTRKRPAWRKLGICIVCGHREAMPKDTRCGYCAEQQSESKRQKSIAAKQHHKGDVMNDEVWQARHANKSENCHYNPSCGLLDEVQDLRARVEEMEKLLDLSDSPGSIVLLGMERNRYRDMLKEVCEIWAGSECGQPVTGQEAYAIYIAKKMYDAAKEGLC